MAVYKNYNHASPLTAVEFTPVSDGNFSFFYVDSPMKTEGVKRWLSSPEVGQEIIAETRVEGHPVLVTHGDKTQNQLLQTLAAHGDKLELHHHPKPFNVWLLRGMFGFSGQVGQLISSITSGKIHTEKGGINIGLFVFSISNLIANAMSMTFGAQKLDDVHRLRFLKEQFNHQITTHLPAGDTPPNIDENRLELRKDEEPPKNISEKFEGFIRRNSVRISEVVLRYFGAFALAFPANKWKQGWAKLNEGSLTEAFHAAKNPLKVHHYLGLTYLTGKTLAFVSKTPDPYNPKPHTFVDTLREKVTFRLGGLMEAAAGGVFAWYGFSKKPKPDYAAGIGGVLFSLGYLTRYFAKFGVRDINMKELNAHITDSIAKLPPAQLPQMMADTAASLKEHLKDKSVDFGQLFTQMMVDLYRYHHIALDNLGTEPEERIAKLNGNGSNTPHAGVQAKHTLLHPTRRSVPVAHTSFAQKVQQAPDATPSIG